MIHVSKFLNKSKPKKKMCYLSHYSFRVTLFILLDVMITFLLTHNDFSLGAIPFYLDKREHLKGDFSNFS